MADVSLDFKPEEGEITYVLTEEIDDMHVLRWSRTEDFSSNSAL